MKRRQFLQAAGLAATAIATPAIAQTNPAIKWRLTSSMPKSLDTLYGASETISKFVGEASDHQFQIQPFAAEWVGPYDDEKLGFSKVAKY
jgi:TRAP-type mannitol/chloroaromatic compound transport system substrate-binding protein